MDIPLNAKVQCADGPARHTTHAVINPINRQVTHVVVRPDDILSTIDYLVTVDYITEASPDRVRLRCTKDELAQMPTFTAVEFTPYPEMPSTLSWPFVE